MKRWMRTGLLLLASALAVQAAEVKLDQKPENNQRCAGMYSKKAWGGAVDPFILVKFLDPKTGEGVEPPDTTVSLIIFEWQDRALIGKATDPENPDEREFICTDDAIQSNLCNSTQKDTFILGDKADTSKSEITSQAIHMEKDAQAVNYRIERTGYYCVGTYAPEPGEYTAVVEFRNAYGELPGAQIPKLPFYGGLTILYAVVGAFWAFLYWQNRQDILPVQNYITAILVFLVIEMLMTWLFYDYQNRHGNSIGTNALMIVVSVLNAGRNSFSFFLLLIVCMGYGVVKPSLGKTMIYVRWLAAAHFAFGVIYAVASLTVKPDDAGPLVLLVVLPLSATLTAFYIWTLNSLSMTMKDLMERKQNVKALMYKRLWWCILGSILVIFAFFFFNSFTFAGVGDEDFAPTHWQTRWFVLDGWLNLVYLADVCFVAYLWRPTANNRRFAMSDEIAQDDEGFEIASIRDSLDEESGGSRNGTPKPPAYDAPPSHSNMRRDISPLPAPKPTRPASLPRASLDGETIFAVGDEERGSDWSEDDDDDDSDDDDERGKLRGKKD